MKRYGKDSPKKRETDTSRPAKKRAGRAPKPSTKPDSSTDPYEHPKKRVRNNRTLKTTEKGKMGT